MASGVNRTSDMGSRWALQLRSPSISVLSILPITKTSFKFSFKARNGLCKWDAQGADCATLYCTVLYCFSVKSTHAREHTSMRACSNHKESKIMHVHMMSRLRT